MSKIVQKIKFYLFYYNVKYIVGISISFYTFGYLRSASLNIQMRKISL